MPPLSDKAKKWIGFLLMLLSLSLGVFVQSVDAPPRWALAAGNALGFLGGLFGVGVMALPRGKEGGGA